LEIVGCHSEEVGPTAVELASFSAEPAGGDVLLTWETASELDNLGFNLYRSAEEHGEYARLNDELIPPQNPGAPAGAAYSWTDGAVEPETTYYYKLEDVDVSGKRTFHGPISVSVPGPAAIRMTSFAATTSPDFLLALLATVGGAWLSRRRPR
jgi:hypothetical protein